MLKFLFSTKLEHLKLNAFTIANLIKNSNLRVTRYPSDRNRA